MSAPLVIAGHGTRVDPGAEECFRFVERVRGLLPGVDVSVGFVELTPPTIDAALADALARADEPHAVVAPLMLGTGGHVQSDIPAAIEAGRRTRPGATVAYARHLGADPRLRRALLLRAREALGDWAASEATVVVLGRGTSLPDTNADHARLTRLVVEEGGFERAIAGFIQVTRPSLPDALSEAYGAGARRIVVLPNYLFPGMLQQWTAQEVSAWLGEHPDAEVRIAGVIGDCDELAAVVVDRYREAAGDPGAGSGSPAYLAGLMLAGRDVLVVGGGSVAERRVARLLDAGASVRLVAPTVTPALRDRVDAGEIRWVADDFADDLFGEPWYALALTDTPEVNARVAELAERARIFCVRGDDARGGTARTPAVGRTSGMTVGVLGDRTPRRSALARDAALRAIAETD